MPHVARERGIDAREAPERDPHVLVCPEHHRVRFGLVRVEDSFEFGAGTSTGVSESDGVCFRAHRDPLPPEQLLVCEARRVGIDVDAEGCGIRVARHQHGQVHVVQGDGLIAVEERRLQKGPDAGACESAAQQQHRHEDRVSTLWFNDVECGQPCNSWRMIIHFPHNPCCILGATLHNSCLSARHGPNAWDIWARSYMCMGCVLVKVKHVMAPLRL